MKRCGCGAELQEVKDRGKVVGYAHSSDRRRLNPDQPINLNHDYLDARGNVVVNGSCQS